MVYKHLLTSLLSSRPDASLAAWFAVFRSSAVSGEYSLTTSSKKIPCTPSPGEVVFDAHPEYVEMSARIEVMFLVPKPVRT